eukprot:2451004-Pyramimonas_sp.AAC.1
MTCTGIGLTEEQRDSRANLAAYVGGEGRGTDSKRELRCFRGRGAAEDRGKSMATEEGRATIM